MKIILAALLILGASLPAHAAEDESSYIGDKNCRVFNAHPKPDERIEWSGPCKDGYAEGQGVLQWYAGDKPGTRIEGEYKHGKRNGKSTLTFTSGAKLVGQFQDDEAVGELDYTASNGAQYHGPWKGGMDGKGVITFPEGGRYEGDFVAGKLQGKGILTFADGGRYEGDFADGKRSGKGVYTGKTGERYEGDFVDNKWQGKGILTLADGARYEGDFITGRRTGKGVYIWKSGDRYEGDFVDGKQQGKGVTTFANGNRYEGAYANGVYNGEGKLQFAAGGKYEGAWKDGKYDGKGVLTTADGKSVAGEFRQGQKIETAAAKPAAPTALVTLSGQMEKGRLQICKNAKWPDTRKDFDIPADGKYIFSTVKAGQDAVRAVQTDFAPALDAPAQAPNNIVLHGQFTLEKHDNRLWIHIDPKGASCIYLNAEAPVLAGTDMTLSGSHVAPDWVNGANGVDVDGATYRYFNALDQTYYIASEVGKSLSFAVHDSQTGSNVNHDRIQHLPVTLPKVRNLVPVSIKTALAKYGQYDAVAVDLEQYGIKAQGLDVQNGADVASLVAQFTREIHPPPHARLILALPYRGQLRLKFANTMLMGGKVEGMGFYRDSNISMQFDTNHDDFVPISAFINFQAVVIDIDTATVIATQTWSDGKMFSRPANPEVDLTDKITDVARFFALSGAIDEGVTKVMSDMFAVKK